MTFLLFGLSLAFWVANFCKDRKWGGILFSLFRWLANKSLVGAISRDLCNKYLKIKERHPSEDEEKILKRVWNLYLTLNEDAILIEDGIDKAVRLNIMKEQHDESYSMYKFHKNKSLMDLFSDILYFETEVLMSKDWPLYKKILRVFVDNAKNFGLDYEEEYTAKLEFMDFYKAR